MKQILLLFLVMIFFSCEKDLPIGDTKYSYFKNYFYNIYHDSSLTVLTYNIQLGFTSSQDPWNKHQIGATPKQVHDIAEIIRYINPGIITLQEVPMDRANTEVKNFIEALADSLNMNFAYGGHGKNAPNGVLPTKGVWGNAILSKFPILEIENIEVFRKSKWDRRSVLRVLIKFNDNLWVNVYNLHHTGKDENEMEKTKKFISASKLPIILGGDFNRLYGDPEFDLLNGLQDVFNSKIPTIDRIYSSLNDTIYKIGRIPGSTTVSDHSAFFAKIKLRNH